MKKLNDLIKSRGKLEFDLDGGTLMAYVNKSTSTTIIKEIYFQREEQQTKDSWYGFPSFNPTPGRITELQISQDGEATINRRLSFVNDKNFTEYGSPIEMFEPSEAATKMLEKVLGLARK